MYVFRPKGVCPKEIHISLQKHIIEQESKLKKVVVDLLVTDFHQ